MNTYVKYLISACILAGFFGATINAQTIDETRKLGQTGFKFLQISVDARAAALSDAVNAMRDNNSSAMFYNPAGMAWMDQSVSANLNITQWIADINYNSASVAYKSPIGVFGLNAVMVDYGEFFETIRYDNEQGFLDLSTYEPTANFFGLGYARNLTDRFAVGGVVKVASQNLGTTPIELDENENAVRKEYAKSVMVYDFGVQYFTGFRSLVLAMTARNFSRELTYAEENFELPLAFRIGLSMNLMDLTPINQKMHSLLLSVDTERPRDYYEQIKIGAEYIFLNKFAARIGYLAPHDEQGLSFGFGLVDLAGFDLDYAYTQFGSFGTVNRLSLHFGM